MKVAVLVTLDLSDFLFDHLATSLTFLEHWSFELLVVSSEFSKLETQN